MALVSYYKLLTYHVLDFQLHILKVDLMFSLWYNTGVHSWLHWRRELDIAADLLYFGLTTFGGLFRQCLIFFMNDKIVAKFCHI